MGFIETQTFACGETDITFELFDISSFINECQSIERSLKRDLFHYGVSKFDQR